MRHHHLRRLLATCILAVVAAGLQAEVAVIAHPGIGSESIDADTVQGFYLNKKRQWPDGTRVEISINGDTATHDAFLGAYVGKSSGSYSSYWKRLVFTGKASMPKEFTGDAAVVAFVAKTPGAIGYVDAASVGEGVKRLAVE